MFQPRRLCLLSAALRVLPRRRPSGLHFGMSEVGVVSKPEEVFVNSFPYFSLGFLIITIRRYTPKPHSDDSIEARLEGFLF